MKQWMAAQGFPWPHTINERYLPFEQIATVMKIWFIAIVSIHT
jgi:hypothetical protein